MKNKSRIMLLTLAFILGGCAFVSVPDGPKLLAIGQAQATHCPEQGTDPNQSDCTVATGGPLSDGLTSLLKDLVTLPFKMIGGAVSAASQ